MGLQGHSANACGPAADLGEGAKCWRVISGGGCGNQVGFSGHAVFPTLKNDMAGMLLPLCYAMSGTEKAHAAPMRYAMCGTAWAVLLPLCYAMSGTDILCPMRCPVLT
eukprot:1107189-Rhodomonas_salina.1